MTNRIEGRRPVLEALQAERPMDKIWIASGQKEGSIHKIIAIAKEKKILVKMVDRKKLDQIAASNSHQGVMAFVAAHDYKSLDEILKAAENKGEVPFLVVCDEISDPHNLGSILRSANGAGAHGVIVPKRRAVGLTAVVAKTSAGAIEYTPVCRVTNIQKTLVELKKEGFWVAGADDRAQTPYFKADLKGKLVLVIGSEGSGMGRLVRETCDFLVNIPMMGEVSSLNASVAAGVLMYEACKQRCQRS